MAITTATQAAGIVNDSLEKLGYDFKIDTTSSTTIEEGFKKVGALPPSQVNALLEMINTVLVFRNYATMFDASKNKTRAFWRNDVEFGGGVADIYHDLITPLEGATEGDYWAEDFAGLTDAERKALATDVAAALVTYYPDKIEKKFHTEHGHFTIPLSISEQDLKITFTAEGFANYIDKKMANVQYSAEVKLQNIVTELIKKMVNDGNVVTENIALDTQQHIADSLEKIQTVTDAMLNICNVFNKSGHTTISQDNELFLVTTPEIMNRIKVQGYANAYNLEQLAIKNNILLVPYGTDLGTVGGKKVDAILTDKRNIVLSLRYWKMKPQPINNTDYINYFLKVKYLKGYNEMFNAVAFVGTENA